MVGVGGQGDIADTLMVGERSVHDGLSGDPEECCLALPTTNNLNALPHPLDSTTVPSSNV